MCAVFYIVLTPRGTPFFFNKLDFLEKPDAALCEERPSIVSTTSFIYFSLHRSDSTSVVMQGRTQQRPGCRCAQFDVFRLQNSRKTTARNRFWGFVRKEEALLRGVIFSQLRLNHHPPTPSLEYSRWMMTYIMYVLYHSAELTQVYLTGRYMHFVQIRSLY